MHESWEPCDAPSEAPLSDSCFRFLLPEAYPFAADADVREWLSEAARMVHAELVHCPVCGYSRLRRIVMKPTYDELVLLLRQAPPRTMIEDQRYWDWRKRVEEALARVEE